MSAAEENTADDPGAAPSVSSEGRIKSGYVDIKKVQENSGASSIFSKAFSNLKNSEFYEEPPPEVKSAAELNNAKNATAGGTKPATKNCVIVSSRQRGNPILKSIRNVPWEYGEIVPDYTMGGTTCALFLSLRYHNLNPNYVHDRLKQLGRQYELRVLLVLVSHSFM
ncbi:mating-type switching protein swi10-like [Penaeus japonicus]|uniref:mating-type switching protein swi10-like n=1 Tax=Penaeus japonicus TaxID=27405 RepID=UPI001C7177EB|nr:mating-type switching protein swi10-like [Penaeus japonicus]XP_042867037.1 mating-type switching protein swi10-like [Penaeus japonicus]XP_042867040.1 mating-type switching protein swi10-like [Penaeus japonicus]